MEQGAIGRNWETEPDGVVKQGGTRTGLNRADLGGSGQYSQAELGRPVPPDS